MITFSEAIETEKAGQEMTCLFFYDTLFWLRVFDIGEVV